MPKTERALDRIPCNGTALRKAMRRVTQMYDAELESTGLTSGQLMILAEVDLDGNEPPTMRELAEALVMDRSALGHSLRPLVRDGFLRLETGETDRRVQHVVLTRAGKTKMLAGRRLWERAQKRFEDVVGTARAAALRTALIEIARDERFAKPPS